MNEATSGTRTAERVLALLAAVCMHGSISLADAARETDLSASTALRLLRTLESQGFIVKHDDAYRPGIRILQLGAAALGHEQLINIAQPALEAMVAETGETAYLSVKANSDEAVYLAMQEGTHSVRHTGWVGKTVPLKGTAVGGALRWQPRGQASGGDLPGHVVVLDGYEPDTTSIAAPIVAGNAVVAALSIVGPTYRMSAMRAEEIGQTLAEQASQLLAEELT
ncbi:IclR family transcriptional regulator [Haematomicrobium sanguinis]|uniref:IclR family transcriptional regulator n=1 Tax=Haematomicrobium sanguinis TaxID=479106 RepID=UPI0004796A01|nr:IclR family transcriptional regulator [Haematomicrobium sanguinis]